MACSDILELRKEERNKKGKKGTRKNNIPENLFLHFRWQEWVGYNIDIAMISLELMKINTVRGCRRRRGENGMCVLLIM